MFVTVVPLYRMAPDRQPANLEFRLDLSLTALKGLRMLAMQKEFRLPKDVLLEASGVKWLVLTWMSSLWSLT
jgi:hypothetical protein